MAKQQNAPSGDDEPTLGPDGKPLPRQDAHIPGKLIKARMVKRPDGRLTTVTESEEPA